MTASAKLPEKIERALTGEDGAHAIECDCDFDPICDDETHQSPESRRSRMRSVRPAQKPERVVAIQMHTDCRAALLRECGLED